MSLARAFSSCSRRSRWCCSSGRASRAGIQHGDDPGETYGAHDTQQDPGEHWRDPLREWFTLTTLDRVAGLTDADGRMGALGTPLSMLDD